VEKGTADWTWYGYDGSWRHMVTVRSEFASVLNLVAKTMTEFNEVSHKGRLETFASRTDGKARVGFLSSKCPLWRNMQQDPDRKPELVEEPISYIAVSYSTSRSDSIEGHSSYPLPDNPRPALTL
jgi:hypothetical protein